MERSLQRRWDWPLVETALAGFRSTPISEALKGALTFLEVMMLRPVELSVDHAKAALRSEAPTGALKDSIAMSTLPNIIARCADALDFAVASATEFDRAAGMLLKRGCAAQSINQMDANVCR